MLVARHYALPTAFAKDSGWCAQSQQPKDGRWRELLEATTDAQKAKEIRSILRDMRTSALPRLSAQHLYQVAVNGLPIGHKVGSHACPLCGSQHDDAAHLLYGCETSRQLWTLALTAWTRAVDGQAWAQELTTPPTNANQAQLSIQSRRALVLGRRPEAERQHPEAFSLLRGLVITALLDHRNQQRARQRDNATNTPPPAAEAAAKLYTRVRCTFNRAVANELRHAHAREQNMHVYAHA